MQTKPNFLLSVIIFVFLPLLCHICALCPHATVIIFVKSVFKGLKAVFFFFLFLQELAYTDLMGCWWPFGIYHLKGFRT